MKILISNTHETLLYAAEELKKYIVTMSRGAVSPLIVTEKTNDTTITLGTLDELSLDASDVSDAFLEDVIDINVSALSGYIAGSNYRSVLMGVYKFCYSAGCRYLRPGENGDYIPHTDLYSHSFTYRKKADRLFRGECTEGAVSYEHIRDTVYYLPKIGMNMYMIEGVVPYTYMHKWYGHVYNTRLRQKGQVTDYNMLLNYVELLERDINKTGVQLHTLGHAWMYEKLGISDRDSASEAAAVEALSDEQKKIFALVDGKRGLYHGSTFYTHCCYSNPDAREMLSSYIIEYAERKPNVDFIHVWLADNKNNQCECEECVKMTPSDWYVLLLNEIDEKLTAIGSDARIVFIAYVDTVRPPEKLRLNNPRRFVFLSAIGSFHEEGYRKSEYIGEIPKYKRNQYEMPPVPLRLKWVKEWKELSGNIPSMVFEYRFYTDMYCDPSYMRISRETHRDMKALDAVGFEGCMDDQTHRMYLPTALPLITMGETLFDTSIDFEKLANEYFEGAFGEDGALVREYLEAMTPLMSPANVRVGGKPGLEEETIVECDDGKRSWLYNPEAKRKASEAPALIDSFLPTIEKNIANATDVSRLDSWRYLAYHADICRYHARIIEAGAGGDIDRAREIFSELREYLSEHELEFHNVFDLFLYLRFWSTKLEIKMPKYYE